MHVQVFIAEMSEHMRRAALAALTQRRRHPQSQSQFKQRGGQMLKGLTAKVWAVFTAEFSRNELFLGWRYSQTKTF